MVRDAFEVTIGVAIGLIAIGVIILAVELAFTFVSGVVQGARRAWRERK